MFNLKEDLKNLWIDYCLLVRFKVFTAVAVKNTVFWDIKIQFHTSQETHYVSATQLSQLMLCKIRGFHGSDFEECRLLGYKTQFVLHRRHITSPLQSPAAG
jgi:hypothetical protein